MEIKVEDDFCGNVEVIDAGDTIEIEQESDLIVIYRKNLPALIEALNKIMQETN